jgi:hypothetical protein
MTGKTMYCYNNTSMRGNELRTFDTVRHYHTPDSPALRKNERRARHQSAQDADSDGVYFQPSW